MIISLFIRKIIMMYTKNLAVYFKTDRDIKVRAASQSYLMELKFVYRLINGNWSSLSIVPNGIEI